MSALIVAVPMLFLDLALWAHRLTRLSSLAPSRPSSGLEKSLIAQAFLQPPARVVDLGQHRHPYLLHLGISTCQMLGHARWLAGLPCSGQTARVPKPFRGPFARVVTRPAAERYFRGCLTSSLSNTFALFSVDAWPFPTFPAFYLTLFDRPNARPSLPWWIRNPDAVVETEEAISFLVPFSLP